VLRIICVFLLFAILLCGDISATQTIRVAVIDNPYASVDWGRFMQYRAALHNHTTHSDGRDTPQAMVDTAFERGFDIFAVTDHDRVFTQAEVDLLETYDMLVLAYGNEHTRQIFYDHINSYFADYVNTTIGGANIDRMRYILRNVEELGGISIINHPDRAIGEAEELTLDDILKYTELFSEFESLAGIEIVNRYFDSDDIAIPLWDAVLGETMPTRPVWGFASDDAHSIEHIGFSYNVFPMQGLNAADLRFAMENGAFYAVAHIYNRLDTVPKITSITAENGKIEIVGTDYAYIRWIADGEVIQYSSTLDLNSERFSGREFRYVRAELRNSYGIVFTQPFGISSDYVTVMVTAAVPETQSTTADEYTTAATDDTAAEHDYTVTQTESPQEQKHGTTAYIVLVTIFATAALTLTVWGFVKLKPSENKK
jgi:hypothetical protein